MVVDNVDRYNYCRNTITPVLPLVYDDALSYIEQISKFAKKLNEVVEKINNISTDILSEAKSYTDGKIAEQTKVVEDAVKEVNRLAERIEIENNQFISTVNARLGITDSKINKLAEDLVNDIQAVNNRTDLAIQQNNEYILSELPKFLSQIKVVNFFTGEQISVQDMFDYLSQFHLQNSINYDELAEREITVNEYIALYMTYTQLVLNGGSIIPE